MNYNDLTDQQTTDNLLAYDPTDEMDNDLDLARAIDRLPRQQARLVALVAAGWTLGDLALEWRQPRAQIEADWQAAQKAMRAFLGGAQ